MKPENTNRYQRQVLLKEFGEAGQDKLRRAKILVIGAGGLGCPALQYLAGAGVGVIGIVDFDTVSLSNLHRQLLYTTADLGKPKAKSAAARLNLINTEIKINVYPQRLTNQNALEVLACYDLIIDGSDNYATRYMVNDACVLLGKPLVYGAVLRFEGQVGVFNMGNNAVRTNYRDLFPEPPDAASSLSCNEAGVLGVLPGIIGTLQATEAIKIITGIGKPLANSMLTFNALDNSFYEICISPRDKETAVVPKDEKTFRDFNYDWFCNAWHASEITVAAFDALRESEPITIIDIREEGELPLVTGFCTMQIPFSRMKESLVSQTFENKIILFCQTGKRSLKALELMKGHFPALEVFSLKGGIEAWVDSRGQYKSQHKNFKNE